MAKLFTGECPCAAQCCLIAARFAKFEVEIDASLSKEHPMGKAPLLKLADGQVIFQSHAISRHFARGTPIYGTTPFEAALVDQWVDFCMEIDLPGAAWVLPVVKPEVPANAMAIKRAKTDIRKVMAVLNTHLMTRTFFIGERITLADIALFSSLSCLYKLVLDPGFRKEFKNLNRWFLTMVHQPEVLAVIGAEFKLCEKAPEIKEAAPCTSSAPAAHPVEAKKPKEEKPKEEKPKAEKPKAEKKPKPEEEDEEEDETHEEKKGPNPLDALPKSKLVMDDWKRCYSNEDTLTKAIPWFWEHYDPEGYSLWFCKYKFPIEAEQLFIVCNSVGGFIQRLDPVRKYGFGTLCIFNEAKPFEIEGCFLFRGKDVPKEMTDVEDYVLYDWRRVNVDDAADKQLFADFLSWEGTFGGRKFNQGKVFK